MEKEDFTNVTEKNSPKEAKNQKLGRRPFLQGFRRGRLDEGWRVSKGSGHKKVISVLQESSFRGWEEKVVRELEHASAKCAFGGGRYSVCRRCRAVLLHIQYSTQTCTGSEVLPRMYFAKTTQMYFANTTPYPVSR